MWFMGAKKMGLRCSLRCDHIGKNRAEADGDRSAKN